MRKQFSYILEHSVFFPFFISCLMVGLISFILFKKQESLETLATQTIYLSNHQAIDISNRHYPYLQEPGKYWITNQSLETANFKQLKNYLQSKPTFDCGTLSLDNGQAIFSIQLTESHRDSLIATLRNWDGVGVMTLK